jgi:hypothetical protein
VQRSENCNSGFWAWFLLGACSHLVAIEQHSTPVGLLLLGLPINTQIISNFSPLNHQQDGRIARNHINYKLAPEGIELFSAWALKQNSMV